MEDELVCAYCGEAVLRGTEDPEHAVPLAINGRFTTSTVCGPCNTFAGKEIDQLWLGDPIVMYVRWAHDIPDRKGNLVKWSPLATGSTQDGRLVSLGRDGEPKLLNSPVARDAKTGEVTIIAADEQQLDAQTEEARRRAARDGREFTRDRSGPQFFVDHPQIVGGGRTSPSRWQRMAAKIALALLAEQQPAVWRRSKSAAHLRREMRTRRAVNDVELAHLDSLDSFAGSPATAVVLMETTNGVAVFVSLLGEFRFCFRLHDDLDRHDWVWVSDPVAPDRNASGPFHVVLDRRLT